MDIYYVCILEFVLAVASATLQFKRLYNVHACTGEDHVLDFDYETDEEVTLTKWFKATNVSQILIAQYGKRTKFQSFGSFKGRVELSMPGRAEIKLRSIDIKDDGYYTCRVQTLKSSNETTVYLAVWKAPALKPLFESSHKKDESVEVRCELSEHLKGIPPVAVYLKDGNDVKQSQNRITINNSKYKCCIEGVAVSCVYPTRESAICLEKSFQIGNTFDGNSSCKDASTCFTVAVGFNAALGLIVLVIWTIGTCFMNGGRYWTSFRKNHSIPAPVKTGCYMWVASQVACPFVVILFCKYKSGCYETEYALWVGSACLVISAIFSFNIAYYLPDSRNKQTKTGGGDVNSDNLSLEQTTASSSGSSSAHVTDKEERSTLLRRPYHTESS